jgi:hypothetical protein
MKTREYMMDHLESEFKIDFIAITENFNGAKGGIWLSAENGEVAKDGRELFDYYSLNHNIYDLGVHKEIEDWAEKHGWWFEWNDPGTIMLWPND